MATLPIRAWIIIDDGNAEIDYVNRFPLYTSPYEILDNPLTSLTGQSPTPTEHDNDDGPPEAVNLEEQNRLWAFALKVKGEDIAEVSKNISALRRHIQGKQSTAYQAYRNGSQPDVKFRIQLNSSDPSPITEYIIQYGSIQDNTSYYKPEALINEMALDVNVNLICTPAGRGEVIELRNDLPSSPHMLEDSNSDGLADGLIKLGTPTTTISTDFYLIGGQSQQVVTVGTNQGVIATQSSSGLIGDDAVAKGYVNINTAAATVNAQLRNGGGTVIDAVVLPAGATRTIVGPDGDDWYEFELSGAATTTSGWQLYVYASASGVTFLVDGLYLEDDQTVIPKAWCSSSSLKNRYDPTVAVANINYLDVWSVPGDMPAVFRAKMELSVTGVRWSDQYLSMTTDIDKSTPFVLENTDLSLVLGNGAYTANAGSGSFHGGNFGRYTEGGTPSSNGVFISMTTAFTDAEVQTMKNETFKIMMRCKAPSTDVTVEAQESTEFGKRVLSSPQNISTTSDYVLLTIGLLKFSDAMNGYEGTFTTQTITFIIRELAALADFDIDCVFLFPVSRVHMIGKASVSNDFLIDGDIRQAYSDINLDSSSSGVIFDIIPHKFNRIRWLSADNGTNIPTLSNSNTMTLTITPIASHILGE